MSFSLIPGGVCPSVTALDPAALEKRGIRLVLADLDNTLAPYKALAPAPEVMAWKEALQAHGIALFLLSNSRKPTRVSTFAKAMNIPYQGRSGKPRRAGYVQAMERMGCRPEETLMVGDQIFTDTLGGNLAGVTPVLVEPIRLAGNPFRYVRYALETPFRALGKRRDFL